MPYNPMGYNYPNQNYNQSTPQQSGQYSFVNGLEGAKSYPMQPNQTLLLMDNNDSVCYMKQSNFLGQTTLRCFKLQEVSEQELRNVNSEYVLKTDFECLTKKLDELCQRLDKKEE